MFFDELSNDEWALLAALVSDEPAVRLNRRGRPRAEPRIVANAVLWILTTGEPWSKLPGRYPSGPTCRRRFEEWQLNGTLLEMVRLLSQTGRTFAYVPQPAPPATAKPAAPVVVAASVRDESLRGVSWKSPESWQAPGVSSSLSNWRSADPIADITRQLSGLAQAQPQVHQPAARAPMEQSRSFAAVSVSNGVSAGASTAAATFAPAMRPPMRAVLHHVEEAASVGQAMDLLDAAISSARHTSPPDDDLRSPLSASLAPRGTQLDDPRGYTIFVAAEQVPNAMHRAWAEIMKDGRRVERSGLVGPRFAVADEAQQYALDWALQWIDRECLTLAAAKTAPSAQEVVVPQERASAPAPVQAHSHTPSHAVAPARPLPVKRHVPEPVAINHGAPLHGPLHAFRGPLRRYPGEPVVTTVVGATTESTSSERYPSYPEFISHAG
ncbi:transposase [Paraburkholderia bryophila]|uniref:transposase n=1 Tax=Paraburkholderia bryophila TaxID=420952 RepID=UPI00234B5C39|nr:transposase [Paraburkholderia bryophila]WCM21604.1 transposase [Paraburkholderia bryophila]